jgi:hypothetical protein
MNNTMTIARQSPFTGKLNKMRLNISEREFNRCARAWQEGELIQNAFPMLSAGEREFIKTGITPEEWDEMFKNEE